MRRRFSMERTQMDRTRPKSHHTCMAGGSEFIFLKTWISHEGHRGSPNLRAVDLAKPFYALTGVVLKPMVEVVACNARHLPGRPQAVLLSRASCKCRPTHTIAESIRSSRSVRPTVPGLRLVALGPLGRAKAEIWTATSGTFLKALDSDKDRVPRTLSFPPGCGSGRPRQALRGRSGTSEENSICLSYDLGGTQASRTHVETAGPGDRPYEQSIDFVQTRKPGLPLCQARCLIPHNHLDRSTA